ncbi:MAG: FG-GAP repeat protein [Steroidobacteraceae bacterium]
MLALEIGLKQLRFSWDAVDGAISHRLLANPDGSSGFTQLGDDIPAGETGVDVDVSVHLHDWANARYLLDACNAGGCTGSNEVGTSQSEARDAIGYFKTSNHEAGDFVVQAALSADGQTLAVAAIIEDSAATGIDGDQSDNSAPGAGAVYVFRRVNGEWQQQAYLKASNAEAVDNFGSVISLSADGRTLAVSAPAEDSSATGIGGDESDNSLDSAGAAYVFAQDDAGAWSQQAYVKASHSDADDTFGVTLALSGNGDTLAVGAHREDSAAVGIDGDASDNSVTDSGAVYVFRRDEAGDWSQRAYVKAVNTEASDFFGMSVALNGDGTVLAAGTPSEDSAATGVDGDFTDNSAAGSGAVYVYVSDENGEAWQFQSYIKAPNAEADDGFGTDRLALSDDGNTLVVGALREDSSASGVNGNQSGNGTSSSGAAYVYGRNGSVWEFQTYLKASNPDDGDRFGFGIAISGDGNTIAVGAGEEAGGSSGVGGDDMDDNLPGAGAVYVFRRGGPADPWVQRTYVKAPNPDDGDNFGVRLALSADGGTLAVVAWNEESAATGIGGDQSDDTAPTAGAVYLY